MRRVMKSHETQIVCQSFNVGILKGEELAVGVLKSGNEKAGFSSNQSEYLEVASVQR